MKLRAGTVSGGVGLVSAVAVLLLGGGVPARAQQSLSAQGAVSSESVFVGEPFRFQIQVSGSESLPKPDVSGITAFQVTYQGGGANSSTSMTIINGKMTREVRRGYNFNYELIAKRPGRLTIPSIQVEDGDRQARTRPIEIEARQPEETDDFKLRLELSKADVYVGETLLLDVTFYYQSEVENPQLNLPLTELPGFEFYDQEAPKGKDMAILDGERYRTMRLRKAMIPTRAGDYDVPPATLTFRGMVGFRTMQDLFFGPSRRRQFRRLVIPSNELELRVRPLPEQGRPALFAGHVGDYRLQAEASPQEVNVGDPITLTLTLSGPDFLDHVSAPPLREQESLQRDFRLPREMAAGTVEGRVVTFTQTIRPVNEDVREIPPIELPYFDPEEERYRTARSSAIPLEVRPTRVVTASDAEGADPVAGAPQEVENRSQGIAHNYEDLGALRPRNFEVTTWLGSAGFWSVVALPPVVYFALLLWVHHTRRRRAEPERVRAERAFARFSEAAGKASLPDDVLKAFRGYFGDKFRLSAGALTCRDVEEALRGRDVAEETLREIRRIFEAAEASRYAGGAAADGADLAARSRAVVEELEAGKGRRNGRLAARLLPVWLVLIWMPAPGEAGLEPGEAEALFREANAAFREANELMASDPQEAGDLYEKAILRYERIIRDGGIRNGKLYYNLGNAYFRIDDLGRAILNYRRAEELRPNDANLLQNLEFARQRRTDRIEASGGDRVAEIVFFWHADLPARWRARLFTGAVVLAWGALSAGLFWPRPFLRGVAGAGGVAAVLLLGSLLVEAQQRAESRAGVILAEEVVAREGDSTSYEASFEKPLHAGTEFHLSERRPGWVRVELLDGRTTWLPESAVGVVRS